MNIGTVEWELYNGEAPLTLDELLNVLDILIRMLDDAQQSNIVLCNRVSELEEQLAAHDIEIPNHDLEQ